MFIDTTKLYNVVDTKSVMILVRKFQSFFIEAANKKNKDGLESKDPQIRMKAKENVSAYWQEHMNDILNGLTECGYKVTFEGEKINITK